MEIEPSRQQPIHEQPQLEPSLLPSSPQSLPLPVFTDSREECLALLAKLERLEQRLVVLERKAR
jgi:hypothetical protein